MEEGAAGRAMTYLINVFKGIKTYLNNNESINIDFQSKSKIEESFLTAMAVSQEYNKKDAENDLLTEFLKNTRIKNAAKFTLLTKLYAEQ